MIENTHPPKDDGRFKKGDSRINRKGRIYSTAKRQMHEAFDEHRGELIEKALELAKNGDQSMVKLALSYCSPPVQHRTVKIDYPDGATLKEKIATVSQAVLDGNVTPVEGKAINEMLLSEYNFLELERLSEENRKMAQQLKKIGK